MGQHISHISEKDFAEACRKAARKRKLRFIPADWDWRCYPDVGFSVITDDRGESLTLGHCNYEWTRYDGLNSEEVIRRESDGKNFIIDTKEQLLQLIAETFK